MNHPHPSRRLPATRAAALGCVAAALCSAAAAQSSPYYIGLAQTFGYESNLIRLRDGQALPAGLSKSDSLSSTALVGGIDQPIGRQRLFGSATLRSDRYSKNSAFNNQGYALSLGLDWQTIERVSGKLLAAADRTTRTDLRDRSDLFIPRRNTETSNQLDASVSVGVSTPLSAEAGLSRRDVSYSAQESQYREYNQSSGSLGLRYKLGGATTAGVSLRQTRIEYPRLLATLADPRDRRTRNDVDFVVIWVPSTVSSLNLRASRGRTRHEQFAERNFSATTGALVWDWQPGGKLRLSTRLARDVGQDAERATTAFSRTTDSLRLRADYELTAKIGLTASASGYRRTQLGSGLFVTGLEGRDNGSTVSLGARWAPLRSLTLGCDFSDERRGNNSSPLLNDAFSARAASCYGQFTLQ